MYITINRQKQRFNVAKIKPDFSHSGIYTSTPVFKPRKLEGKLVDTSPLLRPCQLDSRNRPRRFSVLFYEIFFC